jgi:hypothetical protein
MTKKTVLSAAIVATTATGAVKGYKLLGERYAHLLPPKEQYRIPRGTQPVTLHTSIGDFRLVAASGYYGGTGIFVYAENLVDPDALNHTVLRGDSIAHTQVVPVVTEELTAAFYEATSGQFHLDLPPHTSSGGDSSAFALITSGHNQDNYRYPVTEVGLKHGKGYFKCDHAPTMRMAARTLRTVIEGSLLDRTKRDLRSIADGSLPEHTLQDLQQAKATAAELTHYYKCLALSGFQALNVRLTELKSKN